MKRLILIVLLCSTPTLGACHPNVTPQTPVGTVADVGARIEDTAHEIFTAAQTYNHNQVTNPVTHQLLVSTPTVDQIALIVNRIGHVGLELDASLGAYNAAKAAGKDLTAQRNAVQALLNSVFNAMADVGKALPSGTVGQIDELVLTVLRYVTQARAIVGL